MKEKLESGMVVMVNVDDGQTLIKDKIGIITEVFPQKYTALTGFHYEVSLLNCGTVVRCNKKEIKKM